MIFRRRKPESEYRAISVLHNITDPIECPDCLGPIDQSIGWTPVGLQVWCNIHNRNVLHIDFSGLTLPANSQSAEEVG